MKSMIHRRAWLQGVSAIQSVSLLGALALMWLAAWGGVKWVEHEERSSLGNSLQTALDRSHRAMKLWAEENHNVVKQLANSPVVRQSATRLLGLERQREILLTSPYQKVLRSHFEPLLKGDQYRGFFLIAPDNISLASSRDVTVGTPNIMAAQPDVLERLWAGDSVMGRPLPSDVPLSDSSGVLKPAYPTMFVGAPVQDDGGRTIALLTLRLNPYSGPYLLLHPGHLGEHGETYVFDRDGGLLSETRYAGQLARNGIQDSIHGLTGFLGLPLKDPGHNLLTAQAGTVDLHDRPLTRMAAQAVQGEPGMDLDGYRDYRGVPVVGAWLWDADLNIGFATEQDEEAAYASLRISRGLIYSGAILTSIIVLLLWRIFVQGRAKLDTAEARLKAMFETAVDGFVVINSRGHIQDVNGAMSQLFGFEAKEMIGQNINMLMPEPHRSSHDGYLANYLAGGKARIIGIGREVKGQRKDGSLFPFDLSISEIRVGDEHYFSGIVHDLSEHKAMERALEEERQFNVDTLNGLSESIAVLDEAGDIVFVNARWREFALENNAPDGDHALGMNYLTVTAAAAEDAGATEVAQKLRALLAGELDTFTYEYPCHSPDTHRWFQMRATRFHHRGALRVAVAHQDVTERVLAQEALKVAKDEAEAAAISLKHNEGLMRMALEGAGAGYWQFDVTTGSMEWDARSSELYGLPAVEFVGTYQDWVTRVHPEDLSDAVEAFQIALDNSSVSNMALEFRIVRPDGEERYIEVTGSIERDANGVATAVHGLHFDLTERWQTQQNLLAAKRSIESANRDMSITQQAMDQAGLALFWIDADSGRLLKASDFACSMLGYTRDELLAMGISGLEPGMSHEAFLERTRKLREQGYGRFESTLQTRTGESFPAEVLAFYRQSTNREPATLIAFVSDITERKQAEIDLIFASEAAESANRAKSSFLAAMSHEIRTPMNGIVGMADLLSRSRLDEDQRRMLKTVRNSALALRTIIDDILDFSKIEAGKLSLESVPFSPIALVEEVAETLAPLAEEKSIECLVEVAPELDADYLGDPTRLRQILFNLGSNAIKFTDNKPGRPGRVLIRLERADTTENERTRVAFRIIDNGIGISAAAQRNLFRSFSQAESSTTRRYGGTGLGLAISRHLAQLMDGDISVTSTQGEGSEFILRLSLPLVDAAKQMLARDWQFAGVRLLAVGLDELLTEGLKRLLGYYGAELLVSDAEQASTLIREAQGKAPYQAVLLDAGQDMKAATRLREDLYRACSGFALRCIALLPRSQSGLDWSDSTVVRSRPTLPSEFLRGLAIALGQASPDTVAGQQTAAIEARHPPSTTEAEITGRLILVAEDNETNQDVMGRQLTLLGYAYQIAEDGAQALALWREHRFGLVLTDCHMPEMDGYALSKAIRVEEHDSGNHVPIIAVTANALKGEADRCYAVGMDDYLAKPVQLAELQRMLNKWAPLPEQPPQPQTGGEAASAPADTPARPPAPVDPNALVKMVGDDPALIHGFLKQFVPQAQAIVADLNSAYEATDAERVRFFAHKLKSSARAVGADELADLCLQLESAGSENDWAEVEQLYPEMQPAMAAVVDYIQTL